MSEPGDDIERPALNEVKPRQRFKSVDMSTPVDWSLLTRKNVEYTEDDHLVTAGDVVRFDLMAGVCSVKDAAGVVHYPRSLTLIGTPSPPVVTVDKRGHVVRTDEPPS